MVAASATAILKAIDLSNTFRCPFENSQNPRPKPAMADFPPILNRAR
jgi:hypothetical protein